LAVALITGITGQDGSYLAELLLEKGYRVVGMVRRTSTVNYERIAHIQDQITLVQGDLLDQGSLYQIFETYRPDEVYNLAGQSNVQLSWSQAVLTADSTALGVTRMLDCLRQVTPQARFYQASTSASQIFHLRMNPPGLTRGTLTVSPRFMGTSSPAITGGNMGCLPCQGFFTITKVRDGVWTSSHAKSPTARRALNWAWQTTSPWAIWMPNAIGASQGIMCAPCG